MIDPIGPVPASYAVHRVGDTWLVIHRDFGRQIVDLRLADPAERRALFSRAPVRGRGSAPSVPLGSSSAVVLRQYRHGGTLNALTRQLFLGPRRALRELRVTQLAADGGAPVPKVLCIVAWPVLGPFWSALIGTEEVLHAEDGVLALTRADRVERVELARLAGRACRLLHDARVEHRDLQLRNILVVREPEPRVVIIDLDRARTRAPRLSTARRAQNLGRLARSAIKTGLWGDRVGRREVAAFVRAYCAGRRDLRVALRRYVLRERAKLAFHELTWKVRRTGPRHQGAAPPRPA